MRGSDMCTQLPLSSSCPGGSQLCYAFAASAFYASLQRWMSNYDWRQKPEKDSHILEPVVARRTDPCRQSMSDFGRVKYVL